MLCHMHIMAFHAATGELVPSACAKLFKVGRRPDEGRANVPTASNTPITSPHLPARLPLAAALTRRHASHGPPRAQACLSPHRVAAACPTQALAGSMRRPAWQACRRPRCRRRSSWARRPPRTVQRVHLLPVCAGGHGRGQGRGRGHDAHKGDRRRGACRGLTYARGRGARRRAQRGEASTRHARRSRPGAACHRQGQVHHLYPHPALPGAAPPPEAPPPL